MLSKLISYTELLFNYLTAFTLLQQGSHYILVLKFKDFSRTFKDREIAFSRTNSRRKFTAWTVLKQYLISISVITGQF